MKILFLGNLAANWMSGWQRCEALRELGHEITQLAQDDYFQRAGNGRVVRLLTGNTYREKEIDRFNANFLQAIDAARPEIAWLEWPKLLRAGTVRKAREQNPGCVFVCFQDDNPFGNRRSEAESWSLFVEAIPDYDVHLVKRKSDVAELTRRGARRAELFMHGFYGPIFSPPKTPVSFQRDVSFVGTALDHRVGVVADLMDKHKIPVQVFGNMWNKRTLAYRRHRGNFHAAVAGADYAGVIASSRINLAFVSSSNQDEYSLRTFEIPACGGFMLAERTPAHQELFAEGREAEFFGSVEECADKIRFYLKEETKRAEIAARGLRRCVDSDYSLHRRLREAVKLIESLKR